MPVADFDRLKKFTQMPDIVSDQQIVRRVQRDVRDAEDIILHLAVKGKSTG